MVIAAIGGMSFVVAIASGSPLGFAGAAFVLATAAAIELGVKDF